jgi:hypothetical protein
METSLFGSRARYELLLALSMLEQSHIAELARLLDRPYRSVYAMVESLQHLRVLATKLVGRTRVAYLNPRYFAFVELKALLDKLIQREPELIESLESERRRARRIAKPL